MTEKFTITIPILSCAACGLRDWKHVSVLGAKGVYCEACAWKTVAIVKDLRGKHLRDGWASGVITLPTPMYDPACSGDAL